MPINELAYRCIAEKNMAESLELHVVRAFFAKAEKKSPFSDVSVLPWMHIYEGCRTSQHVSKMFEEQVSMGSINRGFDSYKIVDVATFCLKGLFNVLPLQAEIDACIEKMSDDNKLMRSEDTIFVI